MYPMNTAQFLVILAGSNYAAPIWEDYAVYVTADSGTLEARDCTINALVNLL